MKDSAEMSMTVNRRFTAFQPPSPGQANGFYLVGHAMPASFITPPSSLIDPSEAPGSAQMFAHAGAGSDMRWQPTPTSYATPAQRHVAFANAVVTGNSMSKLKTSAQWLAFQRGPREEGR